MRLFSRCFVAVVAMGLGLACSQAFAQKAEILPSGVSLYTVPSNPKAGDTTYVCWGVAIPSGWVAVDEIWSSFKCGAPTSPAANLIKIEYIIGFPAGTLVNACTGGAAQPSGWIIHDTLHSPQKCKFTPANNLTVLEKYEGLPIGSEITYCTLVDRVPDGWTVVSQGWDFLHCGEPNFIIDNVTRIKRVQ